MKGNVKKELKVLLVIILCITQICSLFVFVPTVNAAGGLSFDDQGDVIKVANNYYEFAFNKYNGGIVYIKDNTTGQNISEGGNGGYTWYASFDGGAWIGSTFYGQNFSYEWHPENGNQFIMHWTPTDAFKLDVRIYAYFSEDRWMKMVACVQNNQGQNIQTFGFPVELKVKESSISDALLPMIPGAKLNSKFFKENKTYTAQYPGEMFADYVAVNSASGKLALYSEKKDVDENGVILPKVQPAILGFRPSAEDGGSCTTILHEYKAWVKDSYYWESPYIIMRIGQDYQDTIAAYRWDKGIVNYKSLETKLGEKKQKYFESPMYKLDVAYVGKTFEELKQEVVDKIRYPGLVHPVAFQNNGHDNNYPDFIPASPAWGSTDDFASFVAYAKSENNLVMPYTNFSWWDNEGPALSDKTVEELRQYASTWSDGSLDQENYGVNSGYVMDLNNSFVKNKITEQHDALMNTIGTDGIFEDQWGARAAPYDYNPAGISVNYDEATSYFKGVTEHAYNHQSNNLMTECGIDVLADNEVGFMGTNYLWDIAGYRGATSPYTEYYPMAGMLFRDKVLLYQHDLAGETWTDNKNMFRWNLSEGYNFSIAFHDSNGLNMDNPWLDLTAIFQKNILSGYADKLVTGFEDLGNKVRRTTFGSGEYTVYSNWSDLSTYTTPDLNYTLPANGAMVQSADGSAVGGVFTAYNRHSLSSGDHYIVETRSNEEIKVYQPVGNDTRIFINKPESWDGANVSAYAYDGTLIGDITAGTYAYGAEQVCFDYQGSINGQKAAYYTLTRSETANTALAGAELKPDLVITGVTIDPANPVDGNPVSFKLTLMNQGTAAAVPEERTRPTDNVITTEYGVGFTVDGTWLTYSNVPVGYNLPAGEIITLTSAGTWTVTKGVHTITSGVDDWLNFVIESDESNNVYNRDIEIADVQGTEPEQPEEIGPVDARKLNIDIGSDQCLNVIWDKVVTNVVNKAVVGTADPDFSGKYGVLWDDANLYLLAEVNDDMKRNDGAATWQNDSVELYLDMNYNRSSSYGPDDFQYRFKWDNAAVTTAEEAAHGNAQGVSYRCIDTAGGYKIVATLPWATLGKSPAPDMNIGFDVAMNDNDTGERECQIIWHCPDDTAWSHPDRFGKCIITADEVAKPDLIITDIIWTPSSPEAKKPVTFKAVVKNQGLAATPEGTVLGIGFQIDGAATSLWSDSHTSSLAAGKSVTLTVNGGISGSVWKAAEGVHTISATVDDVNRIPESEESNNSFSKDITIGKPDLIITGIGWTPQKPAAGDKVTFNITVKNQGPVPTPEGKTLGVAISIDGISKILWSNDHTASLAAGQSVTLTLDEGIKGSAWIAVKGIHIVTAVVDYANAIKESNELNNTGIKIIEPVKKK